MGGRIHVHLSHKANRQASSLSRLLSILIKVLNPWMLFILLALLRYRLLIVDALTHAHA